jgi:hypothetical protein
VRPSQLRLRYQDSIKRVVMKERQMADGERVIDVDWKRLKPLFDQ